MDSPTLFMLAADAVLFLHLLVIVFIVLGLVLIFIGHIRSWSWIRNLWFRLIHLGAISVVVLLSWLNMVCPLTTVEMILRNRAGDVTYSGSFIAHWLETILYYQAPPWVFATVYTIFGCAVLASWFLIHPRRF